MLIVAQLYQGGGLRMLKVRLDTFRALLRISRLAKKSHGAFKPFMAWLRDACYIVNLEDIKEASDFDVTCVGPPALSSMEASIASMEAVKASTKAFMSFHAKRK